MRREPILGVYEVILAGILFILLWLFAFGHGAIGADAWISTILVSVFSLAALVMFRELEEWINLILRLWILVSPWILNFEHTPEIQQRRESLPIMPTVVSQRSSRTALMFVKDNFLFLGGIEWLRWV